MPLTWENVFRSPEYTDKTDKEVVDLLLVLRNRGIFVSMKCQQDPETRSGEKLSRRVQKSAEAALRQAGGGIRTSKTREFWCRHPRRGKVSFRPNQIEPVRALIIVETFDEVALSKSTPLEIESVPVSYLSVDDFSTILFELRTINDLIRYLDMRCSICPELQRTVGIEKTVLEFYVLYGGSPRKVDTLQDMLEEIDERKAEIEDLIRRKKRADIPVKLIEQVSDALSERPENYAEGLDEELVRLFDPVSDRSNYLLMQDELCDLVLDERRKLGARLSWVIEKVREDDREKSMTCQTSYLDSKPDFLYVFSSSKGIPRNEVIRECLALRSAGLSYYRKKRGMQMHYAQERLGYEISLDPSFKETPESIRMGREFFSKLRMFDIPVEKV